MKRMTRGSRSLLLVACACAITAWAQHARLIDFEIKDQFDRVYRSADYEGRILYVIGSDGKKSSNDGGDS